MTQYATPPQSEFKKGRNKLVKEEAIPEAQLIKQHILNRYFEAATLVAHINYKRRFTRQISPMEEAKLSELIQDLLIKLAMKEQIHDLPDYDALFKGIREGKVLPFARCFDLLLAIGEAIQTLGIYKIEFIRSVNPEYAYMADEIEDY